MCWGAGELLLVAVAVGSPAVGALLFSERARLSKLVTGGFALIGILFAALAYTDAAAVSSNVDPVDLSYLSMGVFAFMVVAGSICVGLAES